MQLKLPITALSTSFLLSLGWGLGCGASTSPENEFQCEDTGAPDQGFATCQNGLPHRPEAVTCQLSLPRPDVHCGGEPYGGCDTDSDCTESPNGYCASGQTCYCSYACQTDADCGTDQLCECRGSVSACVPTQGCHSDADCPGSICAYRRTECGGTGYACVTDKDGCTVDADCGAGEQCLYDGTRRFCGVDTCVEGRPFLVANQIRMARLCPGSDWSATGVCEGLARAAISAQAREAARAHYLEMAAMEHASVAAFARFTLQLLGLGAPAALIEGAQSAMADELRHAKLAFAVAGRFGADRQPGALDITQALDDRSAWDTLKTTLLEGCIGETVAAARMLEASLLTSDEPLSRALREVADDETKHAALAWRSVAWLLERRPELVGSARHLLQRAVSTQIAEASFTQDSAEAELEAETLGVLSEARGRLVAGAALRHIVIPAAQALFSRLESNPAEAATV
ncbi:MAG: ferritin-like domain-containing protein [Polyangiaceae bacterium]